MPYSINNYITDKFHIPKDASPNKSNHSDAIKCLLYTAFGHAAAL